MPSIVNKSAFFLETESGRIFVLHLFSDNHPTDDITIFIPPFAEEMNKTRHMLYLTACSVALSGKSALIFDFYGTGDSEGGFHEATLDIWHENIGAIIAWAKKRYRNVVFVSVRLGVLILLEYLRKFNLPLDINRLIYWQPVISGEQYMAQFIRLRMAADLIGNREKITSKMLIELLKNGESIEVAGYSLSSQLYNNITRLHMGDYVSSCRYTCDWLEVVPEISRDINYSSKKILANDDWQSVPMVKKVVGEQFWSSPEISNNMELIDITTTLIMADIK